MFASFKDLPGNTVRDSAIKMLPLMAADSEHAYRINTLYSLLPEGKANTPKEKAEELIKVLGEHDIPMTADVILKRAAGQTGGRRRTRRQRGGQPWFVIKILGAYLVYYVTIHQGDIRRYFNMQNEEDLEEEAIQQILNAAPAAAAQAPAWQPVAPAAQGNLINAAENIGTRNVAPNTNDPIDRETIQNGNAMVELHGNPHFIFKEAGIRNWLNAGHNTNPLSPAQRIQSSANIKRFTARVRGGARRRTRRYRA